MTSGRRFYDSIQTNRSQAEKRLSEATRSLRETDASIARALAVTVDCWNSLAKMHLKSQTALPADVVNKLEERDRVATQKESELTNLRSLRSQLSSTVKTLEQQYRSAKALLAQAVTAQEAKIIDSPEFHDAVARRRDLKDALDGMDDKKQRAVREFEEKGPAYLADPFFAYLHSRNFGTDRAKGSSLTRRFDAMLARRCDYEIAYRAYERLREAPNWVAAREKRLAAMIEEADSGIAALRKQVSELTRSEEEAVETARDRLDDANERLRGIEQEIHRTTDFLAEVQMATDLYTKSALKSLAETLKSTEFSILLREAEATSSPEDDRLLSRIRSNEKSLNELCAEAKRLRKEISEVEDRIRAFRRVENKFHSAGWHRSGHTFSGVDPDAFSRGLLIGSMSEASALRMLDNAHRNPVSTSYSSYSSGSSFGSSSGSFSGGSSSGFSSSDSFGGGSSFSTSDSF